MCLCRHRGSLDDFDYVKVGEQDRIRQPLPVGAIAAKLEGGVVSGDAGLCQAISCGRREPSGYRYGSMNGDRILVLNVEYRTAAFSTPGIAFVDYRAAWNEESCDHEVVLWHRHPYSYAHRCTATERGYG